MSIWLALAIAAAAVSVAMGLMLLARRLVPEAGLFGSPEPNHTGSALAALGAGFAILTAFVLLLAFQSYEKVSGSIEPTAMRDSLAFMEHELEVLDVSRPPPCDERGDPPGAPL